MDTTMLAQDLDFKPGGLVVFGPACGCPMCNGNETYQDLDALVPVHGRPYVSRGSHTPGRRACTMEMVSIMTNSPWTDHPKATNKPLASLVILANDMLPNKERQELLQYLNVLANGGKITNKIANMLDYYTQLIRRLRIPYIPGTSRPLDVLDHVAHAMQDYQSLAKFTAPPVSESELKRIMLALAA